MAEGAQIVGRRAELETLGRALAELDDGAAAMLFVVGEPGIGKTRLLAELHAQAHARRHLVLVGRAAEFERDLPFGLFVAALDDYLASLTDGDGRGGGLALPAELAGIFPSLGHLAQGVDAVLQEERYRAHRAVRGLLDGLSGRRPVVLVLDDVHWADAASTELLCHLVAHRPAGPVLLALAMRPVGTSPRLTAALEQAARDGSAHRLHLGPLSPEDARQLIGAPADPRVYQESGGNPFYLQQLARAGRAGGSTGTYDLGDLAVPAAVRAALEAEIEALSAPARALLAGAAVSGESFEPELAAAAAGMDEGQALDLLDELVRLDVVRPHRRPPPLPVPPPHRAPGRLPVGRARVAAGGPRPPGPGPRAAGGVAPGPGPSRGAVGPGGRRRSARPPAEAGAAAAPRAPATAARWYQAALRLLPHDQVERRLGLLVATASSLVSAGVLADARATLLDAVDLLPPAMAAVRVRLIASCAALEHLLGRHRDAHARLTSALGELADQGSPEAAALKLELAVDAIYTFDFPAMRSWATVAAADAAAIGASALEAAALALLGFAEYIPGDTVEAAGHLDRAAVIVDSLADADLAPQLDATYYLCWAENYMERYDASLRHTERGIALSQASGQGHLLVPLMLGRVYALVARGRSAEACELAEVAEDAARLAANPQSLSWALWVRSLAATAAGDHALALRSGEECMAVGGTVDDNVISATGGWVFGATLLEAGQPERCRAEVLESGGGPDLPRVGSGVRCTCYELLTRAELALGRRAEAEAWAERAVAVADGLTLDVARAAARRAQALVLVEAGRVRAGGRSGPGRGRRLRSGVGPPRCGPVRGSWPGGRWPWPANGSGRWPSWSTRNGSWPRAGRRRIGPRPSGSWSASAGGRGRSQPRTPGPQGGLAHRPGAGGGRPGGGRQHQPGDRQRPLPEREDGGEPPVPHLHQAGRVVAGPPDDPARPPNPGTRIRVGVPGFPRCGRGPSASE